MKPAIYQRVRVYSEIHPWSHNTRCHFYLKSFCYCCWMCDICMTEDFCTMFVVAEKGLYNQGKSNCVDDIARSIFLLIRLVHNYTEKFNTTTNVKKKLFCLFVHWDGGIWRMLAALKETKRDWSNSKIVELIDYWVFHCTH